MIIQTTDFNLQQTIESGQCFRFKQLNNQRFMISFASTSLECEQKGNCLIVTGTTDPVVVRKFFDLDRDYPTIKSILCEDPILQKAISYAPGIHILNQDPWECLVSFIISQQNNIPRIRSIAEKLCQKFGTETSKGFWSFPTVDQLSKASLSDLNDLGLGFRSKYILDACIKFATWKSVELHELPLPQLLRELTSINGVGPKIANCVALFSYGHMDAFPIDVWIKRIMEDLYFNGYSKSSDEIYWFARNKFGENAGIAQQYLYHYARTK